METQTTKCQAILAGLAQLHQWESVSVPALSTVSGRFLYFKMMEQLMQGDQGPNWAVAQKHPLRRELE